MVTKHQDRVQEEQSLAFEQEAKSAILGPIHSKVNQAMSLILAISPEEADLFKLYLVEHAVTLLADINNITVSSLIDDFVVAGFSLGQTHAIADMPEMQREQALAQYDPNSAQMAAPHPGEAAQERVQEGVKEAIEHTLEHKAEGKLDADFLLKTMRAITTRSNRVVDWELQRSQSLGTMYEAKKAGAHVIWFAERDACLHCLAYAGEVAQAGVPFPVGLSYDVNGGLEYPAGMNLVGPPLHPHCRCRIRTYFGGPAQRPSRSIPDAKLPDALKREARRSIALGKTDFASMNAAQRASARLLQHGAALPRTVEARARAFSKRGRD